MISKISLIIGLVLVSSTLGVWNDEDKWNYNLGGSDWQYNQVMRVNQCNSPLVQSPINIPDDKISKTDNVRLTVEWNNGNQDVNIQFKKGAFRSEGIFSILRMKTNLGLDLDYYSTYMEYHTPAENQLHGEFYDLELQIYHRINDKHATRTQIKEAVISILFRKSYEQAKNPFFESWNFGNLQFDSDLTQVRGTANLNINSLASQLTDNTDFYNFVGSYTRPPCTENLNWFVFDKVLELNYEQLQSLNSFFRNNDDFAKGRGNAREIQNVGQRRIFKGEAVFQYSVDQTEFKNNLVQKKITKLRKTKIENIY